MKNFLIVTGGGPGEDINLYDLLARIDNGYKPTELETMELLQTTEIVWHNILTVPKCIYLLENLKKCDFSYTGIVELPEEIGRLSKLEILDLRNSQIEKMPDSIGKLKSLQRLVLKSSKIRELPESVGDLINLTDFFLSKSKIEKLPNSIGKLVNLKALYLNKTAINKIPDSIGNLTKLEILDLSATSIRELPDSFAELSNLRELYLSKTNINELTDSIGALISLHRLFLRNTRLISVSDSVGNLVKLKRLGLSHSSIAELPKALLSLDLDFVNDSSGEKGIFIENLQLQKQPVSLFFQDKSLIKKYYDSEKENLKESKVIFMGDGGAGKSYTIQRIMNDGNKLDIDTDVTHDITIEHWDNSNIIVDFEGSIDFWDFGGQDIYLSMHRCFMTDRSCYVIVLCNRQYGSHRGLMRQARYWLKNIYDYAKDSPILLAVNTWKGQPRDGISLSQLKREFPGLNIVDQIVYDAHDPDSTEFNRLTDRICRMAQNHFSFSLQFPVSWNNIRTRLRQDYSRENYIPEEEYYNICKEELENNDGYYDEGIAKWLLHWFNDLGYCFNYHDLDDKAGAEEYQVMKPQWVIRAMYKIINYKIERRSNTGTPATEKIAEDLSASHRIQEGKLSKEDVIDILIRNNDYSEKEALYIIKVLLRFKLAYLLIKEEEEFLFIPALCSDIRMDSFDDFKSGLVLKQEYLVRFRYLPETVIHQLMIKCYQNGRVLEKVWKYGFHIQVGIGELSVEMCDDTEINIKYFEPENNNNCLGLHEMRSWLKDVSNELGMDSVRDFIVKRTNEQTAFISVKALCDAYIRDPNMKVFYVQDDDIYHGYSVDGLLSGLYGSNYRRLLLKNEEKGRYDDKTTVKHEPAALSERYVVEISKDLKIIISKLNEIASKKSPLDGETAYLLANKLISTIKQNHIDTIEENAHLQEFVKEIQKAQSTGDKGKLQQLFADSANLGTVITALVGFAKYGATLL